MESAAGIQLALDRERYLTYLRQNPARPRDLVEELGDSRATVHRATEELAEYDLIGRDGSAWHLTQKGRLVHQTVNDTKRILGGIEQGRELLGELPETLDVPPAVFSEGRFGIPNPPSPTYPLERSVEKFEQADEIRGLAVGDTVPELAETVYERGAVEGSLEVEYVLSSRLFEWYRQDSPEMLAEVLSSPNVDLRIHDALPVGLAAWEIDGEWEMQLITYADDGTYSGNVVSKHPVAVEWAQRTVREYRNEAASPPDATTR